VTQLDVSSHEADGVVSVALAGELDLAETPRVEQPSGGRGAEPADLVSGSRMDGARA
jgi:hypothetical protein